MKKLLLSGILLLTMLNLSAQNFFPTDSAVWKEAHRRTGFGPPLIYMQQYTLYGDTLVGGIEYKYLQISPEGTNLLRIDSLEKRIYVSPQNPHGIGSLPFGDHLLYDFGVSLGDTVKVRDLRSRRDTLNWIVFKDSTMEFNGQQRRFIDVFSTLYGFRTDRWVEGIGSLSGFLAPMSEPSGSFEFWYELVCLTDFGEGYQYEPDSVTFPYINCNATLTQGSQIMASEQRIAEAYPNPISAWLNVENLTNKQINYSILSSTGQLVRTSYVAPYENQKLKTEALSKGVYFLKVEDGIMTKTMIVLKR